jgi:hypothetical protein
MYQAWCVSVVLGSITAALWVFYWNLESFLRSSSVPFPVLTMNPLGYALFGSFAAASVTWALGVTKMEDRTLKAVFAIGLIVFCVMVLTVFLRSLAYLTNLFQPPRVVEDYLITIAFFSVWICVVVGAIAAVLRRPASIGKA